MADEKGMTKYHAVYRDGEIEIERYDNVSVINCYGETCLYWKSENGGLAWLLPEPYSRAYCDTPEDALRHLIDRKKYAIGKRNEDPILPREYWPLNKS